MQKATLGGREGKGNFGVEDGRGNGGDGKCKERRRERTVLINARLFSRPSLLASLVFQVTTVAKDRDGATEVSRMVIHSRGICLLTLVTIGNFS